MYEIKDIDTKVVDRPFGYSVRVYATNVNYEPDILWESATRLTRPDANGFEADIEGALSVVPCIWCNQPATRIDHVGNLDSDITDIVGFCSDDYCVREAKREMDLS